MSYDLVFRAPRGKKPPSSDRLTTYFEEREHYDVGEGDVLYNNEETGVYFTFSPGEGKVALSFNLNYFRPHPFALEAAVELSALVEAFGFEVDDPQGRMADGKYVEEAFLRGWKEGNELAVGAILASGGMASRAPLSLPALKHQRTWRWNYGREALEKRAGEGAFVPRVSYAKLGGEAVTYAIWPEACPVWLPSTDVVLLMRGDPEDPEIHPATRAQIKGVTSGLSPLIKGPLPFRKLVWEQPPPAVEALFEGFEGKKRGELGLELLRLGDTIDREAMAKRPSSQGPAESGSLPARPAAEKALARAPCAGEEIASGLARPARRGVAARFHATRPGAGREGPGEEASTAHMASETGEQAKRAREPRAREPRAREPRAREPRAREPRARQPRAREGRSAASGEGEAEGGGLRWLTGQIGKVEQEALAELGRKRRDASRRKHPCVSPYGETEPPEG